MDINKIYNMDCLEGMKQIENNSIDLIVTDPPYNIENLKEDMRDKTLRASSKNNIFFNEFDHFESKEKFQEFIKTVLMNYTTQPSIRSILNTEAKKTDGLIVRSDKGYYKLR